MPFSTPTGELPPSVTPVPKDPTLSSDSCRHLHAHGVRTSMKTNTLTENKDKYKSRTFDDIVV